MTTGNAKKAIMNHGDWMHARASAILPTGKATNPRK
jgi:hypothetical protein